MKLIRKAGPIMRITIGHDPLGCASCSHLPKFVRTIRARTIDEAIDAYTVKFPAARPDWQKVIVMTVSK
jgi:hypothetical protein